MPLFAYAVLASTVVPVAVGLKRFNVLDAGGRTLVALVVANCIQMSGAYVLAMMKVPNLAYVNTYRPVELVLITLVFFFMVESRIARIVILACAGSFLLLWILDRATLDDPNQLNNRMALLSRFTLILISIVALYSGSESVATRFFERPLFWVGAAVLLYSSGTLLLLGLGNQLIALGRETFIQAWQINWTLLIIANVSYTKGLLCRPQHRT